jgi:hypothetical protein
MSRHHPLRIIKAEFSIGELKTMEKICQHLLEGKKIEQWDYDQYDLQNIPSRTLTAIQELDKPVESQVIDVEGGRWVCGNPECKHCCEEGEE